MNDDREGADCNAFDPRAEEGAETSPPILIDPMATDPEFRRIAGVCESLPRPAENRSLEPLTAVLNRYGAYLRTMAWQLAWYDRDLRDDLEQEGRIALWRLDPVRLSAASHPDGYRRAVIRHAMLRYLRTLTRQDPGARRIDWRIVEQVLETYGESRPGARHVA